MTELNTKTILVTGAAGFVGFHLAIHYLHAGFDVIGVDNPEAFDARDIRLRRMEILAEKGVRIMSGDLACYDFAENVFARHLPRVVFHMAARTNARDIDGGRLYRDNITALGNVLLAARRNPPAHFLFASSSAVYGEHASRPFCEKDALTMPDNLYGASKFIGEQLARFQSSCGGLLITAVRLFNVYGPWGRRDMAPFYFADCMSTGQPVTIFTGDAMRAWLYIDDAVSACAALAALPPENAAGFRAVNVAGPRLVRTMDALHIIARVMNVSPRIVYAPPKIAEITSNPADLELLRSLIGDVPRVSFEDGIGKFLQWYKETI